MDVTQVNRTLRTRCIGWSPPIQPFKCMGFLMCPETRQKKSSYKLISEGYITKQTYMQLRAFWSFQLNNHLANAY